MLGTEKRAEFHKDFLPSTDQRIELADFALRCDAATSKAFNKGDAAKVLAVLLASYPSANISGEDAKLRVMGYVIALDDVPVWSIERAARRWLKGEVGPKSFAPSPSELRSLCDTEIRRMQGLASICRKIAAAVERPPEITDEQRQHNLVRLAGIIKPAAKLMKGTKRHAATETQDASQEDEATRRQSNAG